MGDIYSAYITVDNPLLLDILKKYKEKGLFGNNVPIFGIGEYDNQHVGKPIGTPAFDYFREEYSITKYCYWPGCPKTLTEVLGRLIELFQIGTQCGRDDGSTEINADIFNLLQAEFLQKETEVLNAFIKVEWVTEWECSHSWTFYYDKDVGEQYSEWVNEDDEEDDENQEQE